MAVNPVDAPHLVCPAGSLRARDPGPWYCALDGAAEMGLVLKNTLDAIGPLWRWPLARS